jgi:hypothetical protein
MRKWKGGAVNLERSTERKQRLLANPEPAGGVGVVGLGRQPRQHHRADMVEPDMAAVVDDEELGPPTLVAHRDSEFLRPEVVGVLKRLKQTLERLRAERLGAPLRPLLARSKYRLLTAE